MFIYNIYIYIQRCIKSFESNWQPHSFFYTQSTKTEFFFFNVELMSLQKLFPHLKQESFWVFFVFVKWQINLHELFNAKTILVELWWYYLTHNWGDSYFFQWYFSIIECNHVTGLQTCLLQSHSPVH